MGLSSIYNWGGHPHPFVPRPVRVPRAAAALAPAAGRTSAAAAGPAAAPGGLGAHRRAPAGDPREENNEPGARAHGAWRFGSISVSKKPVLFLFFRGEHGVKSRIFVLGGEGVKRWYKIRVF